MDTKKFPIEVGQEVFLCPTGNYTRMGMKPRLGVITKIARKYFYVDIQSAWGEAKFEIETFQNVNDAATPLGYSIPTRSPTWRRSAVRRNSRPSGNISGTGPGRSPARSSTACTS